MWLTQDFELREVWVRVHVGSTEVSAKVVSPRVLRADVVDEQGAVPLVQVAQQLGAALEALVHDVRARFEDNGREELRVRLAEVPDTVSAAVRPDARRIHEGARDDHAGVRHGRDVPRYPNVPLATAVWEEIRHDGVWAACIVRSVRYHRIVEFYLYLLPLMINSSGMSSSKHHMVCLQRWTIDLWNTLDPVSHSACIIKRKNNNLEMCCLQHLLLRDSENTSTSKSHTNTPNVHWQPDRHPEHFRI